MTKRLEWVDIAKGIGILLVIWGHCLHIEQILFHLIFVFHMPLFLMLSGYVFQEKDSFPDLIRKKLRALILPYLCFFVLGLAVTLILPEWRQGLSLAELKADLWLGYPNSVNNSSIWFLLCLFFTVLLFQCICKLPSALQFLALLIIYSIGIWYSKHQFPFMGYSRLPLTLDVLPVATAFFALGYYAKTNKVMQVFTKRTAVTAAAMVFSCVGVFIIYRYNGYVNLHGLAYHSAELYLLGGILGTMAVVTFSVLLEKTDLSLFKRIKSILLWYGRHSLHILGMQSLLIRLYIVFVNHIFGVKLTLYFFPWQHCLVSTIIVAFIICPILCCLVDRIKLFPILINLKGNTK